MSLLALPFLAAALGTMPAPMMCYGTEPFWSLAIRAGGVDYKDDLGEARWRVARVDNAMLRPETWRVVFEGEAGNALIFSEGRACSDSDSDTPPRFGVILDGPEMLLRGCCEPEG